MALRNAYRFRWEPSGVCDSLDGNNSPQGAMLSLSNLIPDPTTDRSFVPRPAAVPLTSFGSFTTPGFQSGSLVIGNIMYGMIATGRNAGDDEPFAYNLLTNTFLTVSGIVDANVPTAQSATGDWTPPILAQVGPRIIVTHPGFPGGAVKFGWFDISSFTETTTGDVTSTSPTVTGNPTILGVQPGMTISDGAVNIPAGTTVVSTAPVSISTTGTTHSNTTVDGIPSTTGMAVGQVITGAPTLGIPSGTTIASIVGANSITISQAATLSATGAIQVAGATITMSANATGSNNGSSLTIAGGTPTAPQWGAGDCNTNPLPSVPVGVAQMNGRAYFACGVNGIPFSDSLAPCTRTNANQALTTNDGLAVTAVAPLQLQAPLTGGIVQAIIAFEGVAKMQQITGDQATSNLAMNAMNVATGTLAPLSIVPTNFGLAFVSPQGLRIVNFNGNVSDPIGDHGTGVAVPFIYAQNPSRICAASTADTLRISVLNQLSPGAAQEWWFDLTRKIWTGPHTFPASLIQPWVDTFVMSASGINAKIWQSDAVQSSSSVFVENSLQLGWNYQTALLPDDQDMMMLAIVESTIMLAVGSSTITAIAFDDFGTVMSTVSFPASSAGTFWDQFNWDQGLWDSSASQFRQRAINWDKSLVAKQLSVVLAGSSAGGIRIGNLSLRYQRLGYQVAA